MSHTQAFLRISFLACCGLTAGCQPGTEDAGSNASESSMTDEHVDEHDHDDGPLMILLNDAGREAMGIETARVEERPLVGALDLPGHVELRPGARRSAAAPVDGRLALAVGALDEVAAGDVLFTLDAPLLRELRAEVVELEASAAAQRAWLAEAVELEVAHEAHEAALASLADRWERRRTELEALREAAGGQAEAIAAAETALVEARSRAAEARESGAEHHAEREERSALLEGAEARRTVLLDRMAHLIGVERGALEEITDEGPRWRTATEIVVRATAAGVVDEVSATDGAWMHEGGDVLGLRQPQDLWMRVEVLQSELPLLALEGDARAAGFARPADARPGDPREAAVELRAGLAANPSRRTAEVLASFSDTAPPEWARPGLAVRVTPRTTADAAEGVAVPTSAVRRDGLERGVWVQDPATRSRLVFVHVEVLAEEGGWVWIDDEPPHEGEEPLDIIGPDTIVCVRGAGRLLLATRGAAQQGGHFHADGTFHAEDH